MTLLILVLIGAVFIRWLGASSYFWLIAWPGTVIHELLHAAVGFLLLASPTNINLMPRNDANGIILGTVEFNNLTWYNKLPIAAAPLLAIPVVFIAINMLTFSATVAGFATVWILASILSQSIPSKYDWKIGFSSPVGVAAWAGVAYLLIR